MTPNTSRKVRESARRSLNDEEIKAERARLGIPEDASGQRNWIRYQLNQKGWSQARIGRSVGASESSVSVIYKGDRTIGEKADKVRVLTAQVLGVPDAVLFPRAAADQAAKLERERLRDEEDRKFRQTWKPKK